MRCAAAAAEQPPSRRFRRQGTEYLEDHVFRKGIAAVLLNKMTRELAILGFVSFTATVFMQFDVSHGPMDKASTARICPLERPSVYAQAQPRICVRRSFSSSRTCSSSPPPSHTSRRSA